MTPSTSNTNKPAQASSLTSIDREKVAEAAGNAMAQIEIRDASLVQRHSFGPNNYRFSSFRWNDGPCIVQAVSAVVDLCAEGTQSRTTLDRASDRLNAICYLDPRLSELETLHDEVQELIKTITKELKRLGGREPSMRTTRSAEPGNYVVTPRWKGSDGTIKSPLIGFRI